MTVLLAQLVYGFTSIMLFSCMFCTDVLVATPTSFHWECPHDYFIFSAKKEEHEHDEGVRCGKSSMSELPPILYISGTFCS